MSNGSWSRAEEAKPRRRGPLAAAVKECLNEVALQLSLLNHRVGRHLDLKDVDLECLNIVHREGPISPSGLARRAGLHPATMTGILDRLEAGGWIARERDPSNRRAVLVNALCDRNAELFGLLSGMNESMNSIVADYKVTELAVLADFLRRTADAGRAATEQLSDGRR